MSSNSLIACYIELSESAASYALYSYEVIELSEFFSSLADDLVDRAVHAARAESGDCTFYDTFGPGIDFLFFSHYSTSLMNSFAPFST